MGLIARARRRHTRCLCLGTADMSLCSMSSISAGAAIRLVAMILMISTPAFGFLLPSNLNLLPRRAQGGGRGARGGDSLAISRRFPRGRWEVGVASAAQLQHVIELANATSTEGWAASQADRYPASSALLLLLLLLLLLQPLYWMMPMNQ